MGIFSWIGNIFKPAADLVDNLHTSEEEKLKLRNELVQIQQQIHSKTADLMMAEAKSDHWITAAWRPMCAISIFVLILLDGFKVVAAPEQVYALAEIFLSAYAGGRSLEKIAKVIKK